MSEARNVYPRLCWGCLAIIKDFQGDHALLDYGGWCDECHVQQRGEMPGLREMLNGHVEWMNTSSTRTEIRLRNFKIHMQTLTKQEGK